MSHQSARLIRVRKDAGFTLVESVVALGIFALVAVTTLALVRQNIYSAARLEARTNAAFVAENLMVETRLEEILKTSDDAGTAEMGGYEFEWERYVSDTDEAELKRVLIRVRLSGEGQTLAELNGFWHG